MSSAVAAVTREAFGQMIGTLAPGVTDATLDHYFKAYGDPARRRGQLELYRSGDFAELDNVLLCVLLYAFTDPDVVRELEARRHVRNRCACRLLLKGVALRLGGVSDRGAVLAVGDGLQTDMAGAAAYGIDALFVAGGIHAGEEPIFPDGWRPVGIVAGLGTAADAQA